MDYSIPQIKSTHAVTFDRPLGRQSIQSLPPLDGPHEGRGGNYEANKAETERGRGRPPCKEAENEG